MPSEILLGQEKEDAIEEIRKIESEHDDGIVKTRVIITTVTGLKYQIMSNTPRRVLTATLMRRIKEGIPLVFPIPSNDGTKVMDKIIPSTIIQDIDVEDHSNLEVTQVVPKQPRIRS